MATATKTNILNFASRAWQTTFSGDKLDPAIGACLNDLNTSDLLLDSVDGDALAAGGSVLAFPDNYKSVIAITLTDSSGKVYDPLLEHPGGLLAYRYLPTGRRGRPEFFVEDVSVEAFRLYPVADVAYTTHIDFWRTHPQTPDAIAYRSDFQILLNLGTVYWEAVLRRNTTNLNHWAPLYFAERQKMENRVVPIHRGAF